jgi:hypothetical protein
VRVARLAAVLADAGVPNSGIKADPMGPAMITFRDRTNVQWEFFEEALSRRGLSASQNPAGG